VLAPKLGLIAEGGFVLTLLVVFDVELDVTVLLLVACVTIGSAAIAENDMHQKANTITKAYKLLRSLVDIKA
jgi:hypothetical protein